MTTNLRLAAVAAAVLWSVLSAPASAQTQNLTVDCTKGQTIAHALAQGDSRKPLVLTIRGTCNENVTINRDDVTLQADSSGATVTGSSAGNTITVKANRVLLDRLTVRGGSPHGIALIGGSNVDISSSDIQYAPENGINIRGTSSVNITNCSVQHSGRTGVFLVQGGATITNSESSFNSGSGLGATQNSGVTVNGGTFSSNTINGIGVLASVANVNGSTINSNGSLGINVSMGSVAVSGTTITSNGTNAALDVGSRGGVGGLASKVSISNSSLMNNPGSGAAVAMGSTLQLANSTVTGNGVGISLYLGSSGNLPGGTISSNVGNGVAVWVNSTVQITGGAVIQSNGRHGIELAAGSKLWIFEPSVTVGGNAWFGLYCNDAESSAADTSLIAFSSNGQGGVSCTGY